MPQLWIEPFVGLRIHLYTYPLWFIVLAMQGKLPKLVIFNKIDYFIIAFISWVFISSIFNPTGEFFSVAVTAYLKYFLLYRFVVASLDDIQSVASTVNKLSFLIFIIVIEGIQHKIDPSGIGWAGQSLGWVDPSVIEAGGTGRTQWIGIFDGPGVFCVMYTFALPFVLRYFDRQYSSLKWVLAFTYLIPLLVAIWFTGSRGGFLATLSILALFGVSKITKKLNFSLSKLLIISSVFVVAFMFAPYQMTQIRDVNKSAQNRVEMWAEGIEMVEQNPLFGIGRGNYKDYTGELIAHNSAIEIMGEMGMPGLFFWAAIYYLIFKVLYQYSLDPRNKEHKPLSIALAICAVGYLVSSLFVTLEYETQYFMFALVTPFANQLEKELTFSVTDMKYLLSLCLGWYVVLKIFVMSYF